MKNKYLLNNETFYTWLLISIILMIFFTSYGNKLFLENPYNQDKNIKKLGWIITITTLIAIYITEKTISNNQERRLINSLIIFASTFSYLYYLAKQDKLAI